MALLAVMAATGVWLAMRASTEPINREPLLLAHRGVAQRFDERDLKNDTCTAARMLAPRHALLENTIPSIRASFEAGADLVELDVHPTTDGQFAVFHDWALECRTNGQGPTRAQTMAALKRLDIGYGYTADGGATHPFRGHGVGLMPSLQEVMAAFPGRRLLINVKSRDPAEGRLLAAFLNTLPDARRAQMIVYGGDEPVAEVRRMVQGLRTASRSSLKGCLASYIALGWSGYMPGDCQRSMVLVPVNITGAIWGWPHRFIRAMEAAGSEVFAVGPYSGGPTTGIDSTEDLSRLPHGYPGGIWTNEIERIASEVHRRPQ